MEALLLTGPNQQYDTASVVTIMESLLAKMPENIRKEAPTAFTTASAILNSVAKCQSNYEHLQSIHKFLSTAEAASKETAESILNACQHFPDIKSNSTEILSAIQNPTIAEESLQKHAKNCLHKSNNALVMGLGISFCGLLVEAGRLVEVWSTVSAAKEFARQLFGEMKVQLQSKIGLIGVKITKFGEGIQPENFEDMSDAKKTRFFIRKTRERDDLTKLLADIEKGIGNLETDVNGKIEKLSDIDKTLIPGALGQLAQGACLGVSLSKFGKTANPYLAVVTGLAIVGHLAAVGANIAVSVNAKETVNKLRQKLWEIQLLRNLVEEQRESLNKLFDEFNGIINEDGVEQS